jgi:raffinose/stachyose/melibiose transport system permease protein
MMRQSGRTRSLLPNFAILGLLVFFSLGPLVILVFNALKAPAEIGLNPFGPPADIQLSNFVDAWRQGNFTTTIRNSIIVVLGTVPGVCLISGLAAFSLARMRIPGGDAIVAYLLVVSALPATVFLVPLFFLWSKLGLTESLLGLCIIYWAINSPLATLLLRSYMVAVPNDYEDAARVDGADDWAVLRYVMLPIVWPGFLMVALVTGLAAWNEYMFVYTFIHEPELKTVMTSYQSFAGRFTRDWGLTSAAAIITISPVVLFFLALQNHFIEGLTSRPGSPKKKS